VHQVGFIYKISQFTLLELVVLSSSLAYESQAAPFLSFLAKILCKFLTSMHFTFALYPVCFNHTNIMNKEYP
jgi:hypothetical protein